MSCAKAFGKTFTILMWEYGNARKHEGQDCSWPSVLTGSSGRLYYRCGVPVLPLDEARVTGLWESNPRLELESGYVAVMIQKLTGSCGTVSGLTNLATGDSTPQVGLEPTVS